MRVRVRARESWPRGQPKWFSRATAHSVMAWNSGTVAIVITKPVAKTIYQP